MGEPKELERKTGNSTGSAENRVGDLPTSCQPSVVCLHIAAQFGPICFIGITTLMILAAFGLKEIVSALPYYMVVGVFFLTLFAIAIGRWMPLPKAPRAGPSRKSKKSYNH